MNKIISKNTELMAKLFVIKNKLVGSVAKNTCSIKTKLKIVSKFSHGNLQLPLVVEGEAIHAGKYFFQDHGNTILTEEELKKSADSFLGRLIYKTHNGHWDGDSSVDEIAGKITDIVFDEEINGLRFTGEIFDESIAFKILNGLITSVSVGYQWEPFLNDQGQLVQKNIVGSELSLVINPKDKLAFIKPKV